MPEEGWKRFVESVERTNERLGLGLRIDPLKFPDPLNIVEAQEKYAASINKTRDKLDENERKQAMMNAVMAYAKETEMPKSILYKMYAADMIKLVKATLQGTTTPIVPFNVDPLDFCREAHKVKDELVSHAMELLENDIPITKQGDGWISIEERMPREDALYLVYAPSRARYKPFIDTTWYDPDDDRGWQMIPKSWSDAVTHWMPLPWPPSVIKGENDDE